MPKKKKTRLFSPLFTIFLGVSLLIFLGLGIGFVMLMQETPFDNLLNAQPTDVMSRINPDMTQIPQTTTTITPDNTSNTMTFDVLLHSLNTARQSIGLRPVSLNSQLNQAAALQAQYTADQRQLSHQDVTGNQVDARVERFGYQWESVAENLLANWTLDGTATFQQWQNSPSHNANMMNPNITEVGLAYHVTSYGQVYHAMVLARPE